MSRHVLIQENQSSQSNTWVVRKLAISLMDPYFYGFGDSLLTRQNLTLIAQCSNQLVSSQC